MPFEVWKRPDELGQAIAAAVAALPNSDRGRRDDDRRAVRLLSHQGCGSEPGSRCRDGGLPGRSIVVWGVDGEFHSVAEARLHPHLAAAANWLALANLAARSIPESAWPLDRHRLDNDRSDPA